MNKNNAALFLPLVKALADGKDIEFDYGGGDWGIVEQFNFHQSADRYRVKLAPRVCWLAYYKKQDGTAGSYSGTYLSEPPPHNGVVFVKFVEQLS